MVIEALGNQDHADDDQETQCEHLYCWVLRHELTDRLCKDHHQGHRCYDSADHDSYIVDHANCCDDRVKRKDKIHHHDLKNN